MHYVEVTPSGPLRRWIRCYWFLTSKNSARRASTDPALPDGSPELILNLADPFLARSPSGKLVRQPLTFLVGQITRPFAVRPTGRVDLVAIRLEPFGAAPLWPCLANLTDRWVSVSGLSRGRQLAAVRRALGRAGSVEARAAVLDQLLGPILHHSSRPHPTVVAAVAAIRRNPAPLGRLTSELGTSLRSLQRRFASEVGLSPKMLARIVRFQRVFAAWREDPSSWARAAIRVGYFDQSHLVRDFRDFAGDAPAAFLRTAPEFTRFFVALKPREADGSPAGQAGVQAIRR